MELHKGLPQGTSSRSAFALASAGSSFGTLIPKGPNYYVAYVQQDVVGGEETVLATAGPFTWPKPTCRLSKSLGFVKLNWNASAAGVNEFVALWTSDPRTAGPKNFIPGTKHAAIDPNQQWVSPIPWRRGLWMGYVERAKITQNGKVVAVAGPTN